MRVLECQTLCVTKVLCPTFWAGSARHDPSGESFECEHICWDPKDGELCLSRAKPGETLVEARRNSDVQIDL